MGVEVIDENKMYETQFPFVFEGESDKHLMKLLRLCTGTRDRLSDHVIALHNNMKSIQSEINRRFEASEPTQKPTKGE